MNAQIAERSFDDWVMGFASVDAAQTENLTGYLQNADKINANNDKSAAVSILKTFIDSNKLPVSY